MNYQLYKFKKNYIMKNVRVNSDKNNHYVVHLIRFREYLETSTVMVFTNGRYIFRVF